MTSQVRFVRRLVSIIGADDATGLAAEMAYHSLFALFPFLLFLAALLGFIGERVGTRDLFSKAMELITLLAPPEVQQVLADWTAAMLGTRSPGLLSVGAIGALWGAAGGTGTLIKGLNRAYGVKETRPAWKKIGLQLGATVGIGTATAVGVGLSLAGQWASQGLQNIPFLTIELRGVVELARGPGVALGLGLILWLLYTLLPNTETRCWSTLPGAMFATLAWVALTAGFSFYLVKGGLPGWTFGSLSVGVVLMLWLYFVGLILIIGGEINALLSGRREAEESGS